jgi:hypothetical protein
MQVNPFIAKLNEKNLCSWMVLPWLDLSPAIIGEANFVNAYLVEDQMKIAVELVDINLSPGIESHPQYTGTVVHQGRELLVFNIPSGWSRDWERFLAGRYSKMSDAAKMVIREKSGLKYEVPDDAGNKFTDAILLALDRHPVLQRKWWEVLGDDAQLPEELLSIPRPESFIQLREVGQQ